MMNSARERILAKVRRGLEASGQRSIAMAHAARELAYGEMPSPRQPWKGNATERFCQRFEAWAGTWQRLSRVGEIPMAVQALLGPEDFVSVAPHSLLRELDWPSQMAVNHEAPADCRLAVSVADAAIAETGTLVLCSGPQSPTGLALLPETHVVILRTETILPDMEAVWRHLQPEPPFPPRSLNTISGPSRTADVEQTIQLGAHGPRRLHVLLLGEHIGEMSAGGI